MNEVVPADELGRVHLMGVGGAGMSGIARILSARGLAVSGCDAKESLALAALRALGARIDIGHAPGHIAAADTVVVSSAIRADNRELAEARAAGRRVLPRAAALAAVMAGRVGLTVAGTHGKTTTTSMLTVALISCGADPSFAIGGDLNEPGSNAHHGSGPHFVAEADESDESFLLLPSHAAIVTNVEADHLDHYGDRAAVEAAFVSFVDRIAADGFLVACLDDPGAAALLPVATGRGLETLTYGESPDADLRIERLQCAAGLPSFTPVWRGSRLDPIELAVPGRHNAANAAAALAVALRLDLPFAGVRAGLRAFTGARRRFEPKGGAAGVRVFDDYAHHPTEVVATLQAAREVAMGGRVLVAFQPHRYSRTAAFANELGAALGLADEVVVMDVYAAGEDPIPGVTAATVAAAVPLPPQRVVYEPSWSAVAGQLVARAVPGDVIMTMGAGDVTMLGSELLSQLSTKG